MTPGNRPDAGHDTRVRAVEKVEVASAEQSRLRDEHDSARGTAEELQADASLRAANHEVGARQRWLQWVEEGDN